MEVSLKTNLKLNSFKSAENLFIVVLRLILKTKKNDLAL
tara:strand:- start:509 stop:625 length:117 start_codon:yes stop_codon:yes gene_type:complete